tara:strand:- start:78 stop:545 length:468 start_codon:yes stop_codon:yes gene_type:complete
MGAGGEAPPVKGEDVMILIGSSIILIMFIIQTWVVPTSISEGSGNEFVVKYDLSEGDTFQLEVIDGEVRPTVFLPSDSNEFSPNTDTTWEYTAKESGVHIFEIYAVEDSEIEYSVDRGIIFDFGLYILGAAILGFGIWKKSSTPNDEPLEAVLED